MANDTTLWRCSQDPRFSYALHRLVEASNAIFSDFQAQDVRYLARVSGEANLPRVCVQPCGDVVWPDNK